MTKVAIIYYSSTGHGTDMAERLAKAAEEAGAEVRLRHIAETVSPETFASNPAWSANYEATKDLPAATGDDLVWADAIIFGTPTRFSSPASQFQAFIDALGGLWAEGKLANKVYAADRPRWPGNHAAQDLPDGDALWRHHRHPGLHRSPQVRGRQPVRRVQGDWPRK